MVGECRDERLTVAEAQARLPELLQRLAAGDVFTIVDDTDQPFALLADHPDRPETAEETAERVARAEEGVRRIVAGLVEAGQRIGPDHPLWPFTAEGRGDAA